MRRMSVEIEPGQQERTADDDFWDMVRQIASWQGRQIQTIAHWRAYAQELVESGVIIDCGHYSSDEGYSIRFQLNRVLPGRLPLVFSGMASLVELLRQPLQEVAA